MYAETDFPLAHIKDDDMLSEHALVELMSVAYGEDRDVLRDTESVELRPEEAR